MSEEKKATFWKDEYGDLTGGVITVILVMALILLIGMAMGLTAIGDYYEVQAFNRIHGTDYTFGEWFWAQYTIKDYHLGTVENKNYQVDLNIEGNKEICLNKGG